MCGMGGCSEMCHKVTRVFARHTTHADLFSVAELECVIELSTCTDGTGFKKKGNQSWGPYTAVILNLPPVLRGKFAVRTCYNFPH